MECRHQSKYVFIDLGIQKCCFTVLLFSTVYLFYCDPQCFKHPALQNNIRLMDFCREPEIHHKVLVNVTGISHFQFSTFYLAQKRNIDVCRWTSLEFSIMFWEMLWVKLHTALQRNDSNTENAFILLFFLFFLFCQRKATVCLIYDDIWLLWCKINYFLKRKKINFAQ